MTLRTNADVTQLADAVCSEFSVAPRKSKNGREVDCMGYHGRVVVTLRPFGDLLRAESNDIGLLATIPLFLSGVHPAASLVVVDSR